MSSKKRSVGKEIAPVSRAHRQFEAIAPGFHAAAGLAREWRQAESDAGELYRRELQPLQEAHDARLKQLVVMLDGQYMDPGLDEEERHMLSIYLADAAEALLDEEDDPELDRILERHDGILGVDEEESDDEDAMTPAAFQRFVKDTYDEDIDVDIDPRSPEAESLLDYLAYDKAIEDEVRRRRLEDKLEKVEAEGKLHEAQLEAMLDALVRELGDVQPAAADSDEATRRDREELAQRSKTAIDERDLMQLVEIRLALEARGVLPHFSEKQLALCNKLLKEEARVLGMEIGFYESKLLDELDGPAPAQLAPALLLQDMRRHIAEMRDVVAGCERELTELRDIQKLKAWLREDGSGAA